LTTCATMARRVVAVAVAVAAPSLRFSILLKLLFCVSISVISAAPRIYAFEATSAFGSPRLRPRCAPYTPLPRPAPLRASPSPPDGSESSASPRDRFVEIAAEAVRSGSFRSLSLRTDVPNFKKKKNIPRDDYRGRVTTVTGRLVAIKPKKSGRRSVSHAAQQPPTAAAVLQMTYKHVLSTDIVANWAGPEEVRDGLSRLLSAPAVHPHDEQKNSAVDPASPFLVALGVSDTGGRPKRGMASKLRQCQKFVEIVGGLVEHRAGALFGRHADDGAAAAVRVVDMGCGRGYLTFALHAHLCRTYGRGVASTGIEMRGTLVREIDGIARTLGGDFASLRFAEGKIEDFSPEGVGETDAADVLIALHACDTATDDAIWYGVRRDAQVIVTAPCCHKEVRRQLDPYLVSLGGDGHPMADVLRHGIYRERIAEAATDSMRALLLEIAGYDVKVFEFVGGEHTSKNVMVAATRREVDRTREETEGLRARLVELAGIHGVKKMRLAGWMEEDISFGEKGGGRRGRDEKSEDRGGRSTFRRVAVEGGEKISGTGMPPIVERGN